MDFSKVDWKHVAFWTGATVLGAGVIATLPVSGPILAGLSAAGITLTAGGAGIVAGTISAVSQAKGAGTAQK